MTGWPSPGAFAISTVLLWTIVGLIISKNPVFFKIQMGIFAFSIVVGLAFFEARMMELRDKTSGPM